MLDFFIRPAHAGFWSSAWSFTKEAVSWVIPYESIYQLGLQLTYLATSDVRFDPMELAFGAMGTATVIPMLKPLKPALGPLKALFGRFKVAGRIPFVKAFAELVGKAVKKAADSRSLDPLLTVGPFLLVIGETVMEAGGIDALEFLGEAVVSADDLEAWIEFLALPVDGVWEEDGVAGVYDANWLYRAPQLAARPYRWADRTLDLVAKPAHAATPNLGRVAAVQVVRFLRKHKELVQQFGINPRDVTAFVRGIRDVFKNPDIFTKHIKDARAVIFNPAFHQAVILLYARKGVAALRGFVRGYGGQRVSFLETLAIVTYLEYEIKAGRIPEQAARGVRALYGKAFVDITGDSAKACNADPDSDEDGKRLSIPRRIIGSQGALFHLGLIATLRLGGAEIVDVEAHRDVTIKYERAGVTKVFNTFERNIDVIINKDGEEQWVEAKSWTINKVVNGVSQPETYLYKIMEKWNGAEKTGGLPHRQFFLDRVHAGTEQIPQKFLWVFQEFHLKSDRYCSSNERRGPIDTDLIKIRRELTAAPGGKLATPSFVKATFGKVDWKAYDVLYTDAVKRDIVDAWKAIDLREAGLQQIIEGLDGMIEQLGE